METAALGFLGLKVPKKLKRRVEIWMSNKQRKSMSRSMAMASEQQLRVVRRASLSHEDQYNALRMARYPEARTEDIRRQQIELKRSTA